MEKENTISQESKQLTKVANLRKELIQLLDKLKEDANGSKYLKKYTPILTWGRNEAIKQDKLYTTPYGHKGYNVTTPQGSYSITKNSGTNMLYVNFSTWDQIRTKIAKLNQIKEEGELF
jgi:hypothetical protein